MNSSFMRFIVARFLSALGTQFIFFAGPLIVYQATGSVARAGLSFAIEWGIGMMVLPVAGVLSDRIGGTRLYAISDIVRFTTCIGAFSLLHLFPHHTFLIVSLSSGLMSLCLNQAFIALESVVPKYMPPGQFHRAQSVLQGVDQASQLAGPVMAVFIATFVQKETLYLVSSLAFLVSFLNLVLSRKIHETSASAHVRSPLQDLALGSKFLFQTPELLMMCAFGILVNIVSCSLVAISAAMVTGTYRLSESYFGGLTLTAAILTIASMSIVPLLVERFSVFSVGVGSFLGVSLGGILIAFAHAYWVFFIGFAIVVASDAVAGVYVRTERAKIIPREHLGKTLGLMVLVLVSSYPLSGLLVGAFSEVIGIQPLILTLSIVCLVGNVSLMYALSKRKNHSLASHTAVGA